MSIDCIEHTTAAYQTPQPSSIRNVHVRPSVHAVFYTVKRGISYDNVYSSVYLSHSWVTPKQLKISKYALQHTMELCLQFLEEKFRNLEFRDSHRMSALKRGTPPSTVTICRDSHIQKRTNEHTHMHTFIEHRIMLQIAENKISFELLPLLTAR